MYTFSQSIDDLPRISLNDLDALWNIEARHDAKFIMDEVQLETLLAVIRDDAQVLDIEGRTQFIYRTEYFDTVDRKMYRHHVQGRMRRMKIRERTYVDAGRTQIEIKARQGTSETHKTVLVDSQGLDERSEIFISEYLQDVLGETRLIGAHARTQDLDDSQLSISATTTFTRITLFRITCNEKITIDLNLELGVGDLKARARPSMALVEVKSASAQSQTVSLLRKQGMRPVNFSKYSSAIDLLVSERPRVHTRRTLSKVFNLDFLA